MTQPSPTRSPSKLGRYEIVDELGKGAMGVVYLARDPLIGRLVALKTFRIGYSIKDHELEQFRARFIREAQSAGILSHPGIVTIHDVVEESDDGLAFIAMEYVRGTDLKALLQRDGPFDLATAVPLIEQVADALDYAHSRGVVHRDIKPANIILTADNRVKITDFGIARLDTSNLTQEGQLLGTPNYMAPEQILGKELDHRADLFSLGVVLYEMLTRHKPFQGDNLTVVSHRIVYDHFTPPGEYVKDLPPGVERILSRALEKEPANRYRRASEMAHELRRLVDGPAAGAGSEPLSQTQNLLSATAVVPLPPPPALPASPVNVGVPPPAAVSRPRRAAWRIGPSSPQRLERLARLANIAWVTAFACVLLAVAAFLWVGWGDAPPPDPAERARAGVLPLLTRGHELLRNGRWQEAAAFYGKAERLAPDLAAPRRWRVRAERFERDFNRLLEEHRGIAGQLTVARAALDKRRFDEAAVAASAVLGADPTNSGAQDILIRANRGRALALARPGKVLRSAPPVKGPESLPALAEVPHRAEERTEAAPVEPQPAEATLTIQLNSELPKGTIQIFLANKTVYKKPFNFYERRGLLSRKAHGGTLNDAVQLPAGNLNLSVYLTPEGKLGQVVQRSGNFPGGGQRRLLINLAADGQATFTLE